MISSKGYFSLLAVRVMVYFCLVRLLWSVRPVCRQEGRGCLRRGMQGALAGYERRADALGRWRSGVGTSSQIVLVYEEDFWRRGRY